MNKNYLTGAIVLSCLNGMVGLVLSLWLGHPLWLIPVIFLFAVLSGSLYSQMRK